MALHPFIEAMIASLAGRPALSAGSPNDARAMVAAGRAVLGKGPEMAEVRALSIPTRGGPLAARHYMPTATPDGLVVYLHGGGWVVGALDDYDALARALAEASGFAVLLPDYRLAPEHPYPAGLKDCEDLLAAVLAGSVDGLPAGPVVLAGDSAGANLATVALMRSPDRGRVALQLLYYPVTDCDFANGSYRAHGEGLPLTARDMEWFFGHYAPRGLWSAPDISPIRAADLAGQPPAVVVTAEYDVLCDEGEAYAERLRQAGVKVTLRRAPGVTHGFIRLFNLFDVAKAEIAIAGREISGAALMSAGCAPREAGPARSRTAR